MGSSEYELLTVRVLNRLQKRGAFKDVSCCDYFCVVFRDAGTDVNFRIIDKTSRSSFDKTLVKVVSGAILHPL